MTHKLKVLRLLVCWLAFASTSLIANAILLNGGGATFPYPLYTKWFAEFNKIDRDVRINYQSIGSGGGIRQIMARTLDFAASDLPLNDAQLTKLPSPILHIPTTLGAIVIVFNINGAATELKLDSALIADIFLGKVTLWDDPRIKNLNPQLQVPAKMPIVVVHRSDGSGTTAIFSSYLAKVSPEWHQKVGTGTAVNWPSGLGGKGNEGVTGLIKQNPGSLGYVELIYAENNKLAFAAIKNKAGEFLKPSASSVTAAANELSIPEDLRISITEPNNKDAYPICGLTYLLVFQTMPGIRGEKFTKFLRWAVREGQSYATSLAYAPLPETLIRKIEEKIATINTKQARD